VSTSQATEELLDRLQIRELVDNWAIHRDNRDWTRFLNVWHEDGAMMTTWGGRASPRQFIEAATRGFEHGDRMLHSIGGVNVTVSGDRAIALSKLRIMQRGLVEGVRCDVTCIGINFDFFERRDDRWGLVLRQPVYERDYLAPTDPATSVTLDPEILARRPEGYQRLAYLQEGLGYTIKADMPTETGAERDALVAAGEQWLAGQALNWPRVTAAAPR
jgi:ketosteroid isomerase-like protein